MISNIIGYGGIDCLDKMESLILIFNNFYVVNLFINRFLVLIWVNAEYLLAGSNTMSFEQRQKFNIVEGT